ncbi:MAG: RsmB/NOP family class I SAM-dependent RNA methyltransferase [Pigmentiphaga sp.]|nr:RsmB/NOP family class I SAM-dependent RNA methyltransferase [Pigmentiphaga sp.]
MSTPRPRSNTRPQRSANAPARKREDAARPVAGKARTHPILTRIEQVRSALGEILQWSGPADVALSSWLRANPRLGGRDRHEVAEAVYDVLRHLRRYRQLAETGRGNATRRLAILGLGAVLGHEAVGAVLDAEEAAWLAHLQTIDPLSLSPAVRHSVPDWLLEALADEPALDALLEALNQSAALDIRVNPLKVDRETLLAELQQAGQDSRIQATPYSPFGVRLQGRPPLGQWSRFQDGSIEVQDEGSQLLALLLGPKRGEMIIDFCAGAGGKTLLLGALMRSTGRLYAFDVSQKRLARLKPRLARSGLSNVMPQVIASENDPRVKRLARKAHRVLVDAPCSGMGTLRRNPDLKWRQSPQSVEELVQLQARILASAARCVSPGGRLVYATCSLLRVENEGQVEAFLAAHPDFELLEAQSVLGDRVPDLGLSTPYLRLRPDMHQTDGFFAAVLQRKVPSAEAPVLAETD